MPTTTSSLVRPFPSTKLTFPSPASYPPISPEPPPSQPLLHGRPLTLTASRLPFVPCCSTAPFAGSVNEDAGQESSAQPGPGKSCPVPENHSPGSSVQRTRGLVLELGEGKSWDSAEVGSPVVKRFLSDEGERWYMWYHGRSHDGGSDSSPDSIGLAISYDGIHWERGEGAAISGNDAGLVMSRGSDWWCFDTTSVRPSEVLVMSSSMVRGGSGGGVYWMYYTGYSSETINLDGDIELSAGNSERLCERGGGIFKSLPGLAMSRDGRHWARIEGEHHSGALFDVGSANEWDSLYVGSPRVVFHGKGDIRMYYHSFDTKTGEFRLGIARSRDGMRWVKLGKVMMEGGRSNRRGRFDEKGAVNAHVVRNREEGRYLMVYEGVGGGGGGRRSIGMAVSEDGLKGWRRVGDEERGILEGSGGEGWDGEGVGCPYLVEMDGGEWRLYYVGLSYGGRKTGIGIASSQGRDFTRFHKLLL